MGVVQSSGKRQTDAVAASTVTYNAASNFTAGNTVIITLVHFHTGSRISGITVSGTAATRDVEKSNAGNNNHAEIWRATNIAGGNTQVQVTFPGGNNYISLGFEEWDNIATTSPLDQTGTGGPTSGSSAPSATTAGATSQADEVAYAVFCDYVGTNWTSSTPPAGYTEAWEEPNGAAHEAGSGAYKVLSATGTETATFTTGANMAWVCALATYKLAGSASGPVGLATETDTALALAAAGISPGVAIESDVALSLVGLNLADDGDLLLFGDDSGNESSMGGLRLFGGFIASASSGSVGVGLETDTAVACGSARPAGVCTTTDTALAPVGVQLRAAGLSSESDVAFALSAVQIAATGRADEADSAFALTATGGAEPGIAAETDAAFALSSVQILIVTAATEADTALQLAGIGIRSAGIAEEIETALSLGALQLRSTGIAIEADEALALLSGPQGPGIAVETDTALALAINIPGSTGNESIRQLLRRRGR